MVDITPFKGLLFNQEKIVSLDQVTAPPYDVISSEQQDALYEKSPYNIVRLILERQYPEDDEETNRYTRSSVVFKKWIEDEILVEDVKPSFYVYSQVNQFVGLVFLLEYVRKTSIQGISALTSSPLQKQNRIV